jgi:alpha-D-xyloside xylohydrolase
MQLDWSKLDLVVFAKTATTAKGLVCLPSDNELHELTLNPSGGGFALANDPLAGTVTWNIRANSDE